MLTTQTIDEAQHAGKLAHSTPDPDLPPPGPNPNPDDVPPPANAPVQEPRQPAPPIKA
jgi:hypothetical protein